MSPSEIVQGISDNKIANLPMCTTALQAPLLTRLDLLFSTVISGKMVSVGTASAAMRQVARYRDQYGVLAVCYFSCNDRLGRTEALHDAVTAEWNNPR
jgi:hypothetical protein